jgi:hypothetical protein
MNLRIKSTKTTVFILGIYQIIGAILGFYLIAWLLLQTQEINGILLLIYFIAIGLYGLSFKAGTVLVRKDYRRGLILSMINQFFQVIAIGFGGYKFDFFSGAKFITGLNFTNGFLIKFDFGLTSQFNMSWNSGREYFIYINLLAIFLIYVIMDIYEELFKKTKKLETIELNLNNKVESNTPPNNAP